MFSECFVYLYRYGFGKRPNIQEPRAKDYHKINVEQFLGTFRESLNKTKVSQMTEAFELLSIIANPLKDVRGYRFYL